jgi:hypothetical protein
MTHTEPSQLAGGVGWSKTAQAHRRPPTLWVGSVKIKGFRNARLKEALELFKDADKPIP